MIGEYYHTIQDDGGIFLPARLRPEKEDCLLLCWRMRCTPNAICFAYFDDTPTLSPEDSAELIGDFIPFTLRGNLVYFPQEMRSVLGDEKEVVLVGVGQHAELYAKREWEREMSLPITLPEVFHNWEQECPGQ